MSKHFMTDRNLSTHAHLSMPLPRVEKEACVANRTHFNSVAFNIRDYPKNLVERDLN